MKIPFLDLNAQYIKIEDDIKSAINMVLESKKFIQNEFCRKFSKDFLNVHGGNFGVGCSNGTSAIFLALKILDIGPDDEVITANNTFFATVEAIIAVGAKPILVDCLPDTYGIDPDKVEKEITKKTKAILPVHLYGNPCEMDRLCEIAIQYNLHIIEDCAQAHLAHYKNKPVGTFGKAGTFSFFPGKNLGAYGDAGFVLSDNEDLIKRISMYLNHGRTSKYEHQFWGGNYRMDDIQGAILSVKCKYISEWTNRRIAIAQQYNKALKKKGYKIMEILPHVKCVYHLYVIEVDNRKQMMDHFQENNVNCGIHYPITMGLQPACVELGYKKGDFPVSERVASRILSLPIYPEMTNEAVKKVINLLS